MSILVSLVAFRQLLHRVSLSSQLSLRSMRSLNTSYNSSTTKKFSTVLKLNVASKKGGVRPLCPKQLEPVQSLIKKNSKASPKSSVAVKSSILIPVQTTGSSGATRKKTSAPPTSSSSLKDLTFGSTKEIFKFLKTVKPNTLDDKTISEIAKKIIPELRICLMNENVNGQEILNNVGMKNLCSCIEKTTSDTKFQLEVFAILIRLNAPGNHPLFQRLCDELAKNIETMSNHQLISLKTLLTEVNQENQSKSMINLQNDVIWTLQPPNIQKFSNFVLSSLDQENFDSVTLDHLLGSIRERLTLNENLIQHAESIVASVGMQRLCQLMESTSNNPFTFNSLQLSIEIFKLLTSTKMIQFVFRVIRERLQQEKLSPQELNALHLTMDKLTPKLKSSETEVIENILVGESPIQILNCLSAMGKDDNNFTSQRLHRIINKLLKVLTNDQVTFKQSEIVSSPGMEILCDRINQEMESQHVPSDEMLENLYQIFELLAYPPSHPTFSRVVTLLEEDLEADLSLFVDRLDDNDTVGLRELTAQLKFCVKSRSIPVFEKCLLTISDKIEDLKFKEARSILWSIMDFIIDGHDEELKFLKEKVPQLLNSLFDNLTLNVGQLSATDITTTFAKCTKLVRDGKFEFYHANFVEAAVNRCLDIGDETTLMKIMWDVTAFRHFNPKFMEAVSDIFIKNESLKASKDENDETVIDIQDLLSKTDYKPKQWKILKDMLLNHPAMLQDHHKRSVSHVLGFLVLDLLPNKLLRKIFSLDYVYRLDEWLHLKGHGPAPLLLINHAVKKFHPKYKGPLPSSELVTKWEDKLREETSEKNLTVKTSLHRTFGPKHVLSGIVHEGVFIDHCVAFLPNGSQVQVKEGQNLLDVNVKGGSLVLVTVHYQNAYAGNTKRMRGIYHLSKRLTETLGPVLAVDHMIFGQMTELQRASWIRQQILDKQRKYQKKIIIAQL